MEIGTEYNRNTRWLLRCGDRDFGDARQPPAAAAAPLHPLRVTPPPPSSSGVNETKLGSLEVETRICNGIRFVNSKRARLGDLSKSNPGEET
jgi:hypothetical protein